MRNGKRWRSGQEGDSSIDRLSHLPEPILYHILSFLDTKSAVQTAVLSRSWNRVWKHVTVLDLSCLSFRRYRRFRRFVSKVLSLRYKLKLRKLSYMDNDYKDDAESDGTPMVQDVSMCAKVIKYAFSHDAQHLVINLESSYKDIEENDRFSILFGTISNCTLKTLELKYVCIDDGLGSCGFGVLTTLSLESCTLASDQHKDFFSNFPSLKNLVLDGCEPWDYNSPDDDIGLRISGPQLLSLKLHGMVCSKMEIYAPRLKFFTLLHGLGSLKSTELSFPSLVHAAISVGDWCLDYDKD